MVKKYLKETYDLFIELGSTRKVADVLGISRRSAQHRLKLYRETLSNQDIQLESPSVEELVTPLKHINLTLKDGVVIVFSDAHLHPKQDYPIAAKALLKVVKDLQPDVIVDGGDLLDLASISKHDKLGWEDSISVKDELDVGFRFLSQLSFASPNSKCIELQGNHTDRMDKFLVKHCPQFKGLKGFRYQDQLPPGWDYSRSLMINDNTMFLHQFNQGVHAAYNNVMKSGISIVTGHTHILEVKPFTDYTGTRYGIQTGTLADPKVNPFFEYTLGTPLNWNSGFVVLTYANSELINPELCTVSKAGAFFRGKKIM